MSTSTSTEVGQPRAPAAFWSANRDAIWALAKRLGIPIVVFGIPAFFVSKFLAELSGGALWLPPQWRATVQLFGIALGLTCFNLARHRKRPEDDQVASKDADREPRVTETSVQELKVTETTVQVPGVTATSVEELKVTETIVLDPKVSESSVLELGAFKLDAKGRKSDRAAQRGALRWYSVALCFLTLFMGLRVWTVVPWNPTQSVVEVLYGDGIEFRDDTSEGTPVITEELSAPVFLELKGSDYVGSLLVPPRRMLSPQTKAKLDYYYKRATRGDPTMPDSPGPGLIAADHIGLRHWLDHAPNDLIDQLSADRFAILAVILLFLVLHLATLCAAALGYGYAFSILEELAGWIA